jgi:hypothetical protein
MAKRRKRKTKHTNPRLRSRKSPQLRKTGKKRKRKTKLRKGKLPQMAGLTMMRKKYLQRLKL